MMMDAKTDNLLNTSRICRFCLSQAGVMSSIFEPGELNSLPLSSKIMAFISVQVYVNDGLPSLICHRCLYQVEKSYDFKTQCEASDAMLRKYLTAFQSNFQGKMPLAMDNSESTPTFDSFNLVQFQKSMVHTSVFNDSPFKRKRGRPRKEENLIFYSSPVQNVDPTSYPEDEIKIVDGIESVVTVVDPRSEMFSNSDEENKVESDNPIANGDQSDRNDSTFLNHHHHTNNNNNNNNNNINNNNNNNNDNEVTDSLAIAKAKAKKYMGVVIEVDESGARTRRHLCKGCGKTFGHCSDLRKHVLVHTGERPFHCRICSKTFSRSTNLNKHMKVHTGQKPFFCTDCPKAFATKGDLQRHLIIHSGIKPYSCPVCSQCFSRKDKLTRHLKLHDGSGGAALGKVNFKCEHCSAVYHSEIDLGHHVESMHSTDVKTEEEEDEDGKSNPDDACCKGDNKSEESSSNDKDVAFKIEKEESSPEMNLDGVESMVINIDPFQVESDLGDAENLWDNERDRSDSEPVSVSTADKIGPFECKMCEKRFAEPGYLRSHIVTHSAHKPHKCSLCDKSFTRRRELLRHETVHTGVKPFACSVCGKAFSRKDKLVRHEKIHNGVKRLSCQLCPTPVSFAKLEDLLVHHQGSHAEDASLSNGGLDFQFQCDLCAATFTEFRLFEEHMITHELQEECGSGREYNGERVFNSDDEK